VFGVPSPRQEAEKESEQESSENQHTAAMPSGTGSNLNKAFPERTFDVAIPEQRL